MSLPLALILEDEYLIANDLAGDLKEAGFEVECVASEKVAETWLDRNTPNVAIIDIKLLDGADGKTAMRLKGLGIPFIVHSGFDPAFQAAAFHNAPFLPKPAPTQDLVSLALRLAK
ncbi:response regulator [Mesorhizobium sp. WSM3876]|uniref:response regulator n=1 Tax=Mesorhizobium sp. WSM3876 TaxID=422277 RepID=UPI000BB071A0|nr:response regulator [Mesorhizobium sp. WSM3876]PBB83321.1 histidine kinase [Mesorhizobium sp. WSM3876]TGT53262.1 response regulator [Mesorhizobium sp. M00.F.Ca.ET.170.01.1.1]